MISLHSGPSLFNLALNLGAKGSDLRLYVDKNWALVTTSCVMPLSSRRPLWIQARVLETRDETNVRFLCQHHDDILAWTAIWPWGVSPWGSNWPTVGPLDSDWIRVGPSD